MYPDMYLYIIYEVYILDYMVSVGSLSVDTSCIAVTN